jgi:hypothetical protein
VKFDSTNETQGCNIKEENITCGEISPQKTSSDEASPVTPNTKENLKDVSTNVGLNLSGILYTDYTPPRKATTRSSALSARKAIDTTPKPVLGEAISNLGSPINSKSMHLIDLTTPLVQKAAKTSTPTNLKRTPRSVTKNTPALRKQILLKSAIKSSAAKTRPELVTPKEKRLFSEDDSTPQSSLSTIELSDSSIDDHYETVESKESETQNIEESMAQNVEESGPSSDREMQELLKSISSVLNEEEAKSPEHKKIQEHAIKLSLLPESDRTLDVEANFEKICEKDLSGNFFYLNFIYSHFIKIIIF